MIILIKKHGNVGTQGSRRPPGGWPSRPLQLFPLPPVSPGGEFPPATPSGGSRGRARAFLCSSPVTATAFSLPHSGKGVAGPFRCPRSGTALADPRAVFYFPAACFVRNLLGWFCVLVSKICLVGVRRCSRRGRAAASLPTGLVHRLPRLSPRPSLAVAIVRRGRAALRSAPPLRPLVSAPVRPVGAPSLPPGRAGRPLRGDRPAPPAFCTSPLPGPGRPRFARTAGPRALRPASRPRKPADAPLSCAMVARLPPVTSFVGDRRPRAIIFLFGRRDSPSALLRTRHVSLVRALALETAKADSRAPDGPVLRSCLSGRALRKT